MSTHLNVYAEVRILPSAIDQVKEFISCEIEFLQGITSRLDDHVEHMVSNCYTAEFADHRELLSAIQMYSDKEDFEFRKKEAADYLKRRDLYNGRDIGRLFRYLFYFLCFPVAKQVFFIEGAFHLPVNLFNHWLDTQPAIENLYWHGETSNDVIEDIKCNYCTGPFESFLVEDSSVNEMIWSTSWDFSGFLFKNY